MTWEAWATLLTVGLVLFALARNLAGPDVVFVGAVTLLMTLGLFSEPWPETGRPKIPTPRQFAELFGNDALLTVGVLYVVAAGLTETGGLGLVTERLLGRPKTVAAAQTRMMLPVAAISSLLNNTPVVAMFTPVVHDWCRRSGLSPSKLFIPLSYAAILGGTCTLIGTSTNLVLNGLMVNERKTDPTMPVMGLWTIGAVGVPAALVGIGFILLASPKLLPDRRRASGKTLADPRQYTVEMLVQPGSAIDGQSIEDAGLRHLPGLYLAEIEREGGERLAAVGPEQVLRGGDRLIFVGVVESVKDLQKFRGLVPATDQVFKLADPRRDRVLLEAVVGREGPIVGRSIREGRFRTRYDAAVIAVHRDGRRVDAKIGDIVLEAGDTLLLEAHPRFLDRHRDSRDFLLVSRVADSQPPRHDKAWTAIVILAGMVVAMTFESFSDLIGLGWLKLNIFHIALVAAGLMVLTRCCSGWQARRSVDWPTLIAIGASFGIGKTMETTGLAEVVSGTLMRVFQPMGAWGVLAGVYLITLLFTELVTNNAAAVLSFPIALAASRSLGVDFMPFAIAIAVASSAGFAVPGGYATHLMVNGPGGYRFNDWLRIGVPMDLIIMVVTVALAPVVFPF